MDGKTVEGYKVIRTLHGYAAEKNIKLLIIGDGPDMVEYGELVKKLNLQNNIILGGK